MESCWLFMMIKDKNTSGVYHVALMVLACILLLGVVWLTNMSLNYDEKYRIFRYNARLFAFNASSISKTDGEISLSELINEGYFAHIKNPFLGDSYCSITESKVTFQESLRYITLRCGNYLIDHQYVGDSKYNIYQVTQDWQEDKIDGSKDEVRTKLAYNYQEDNHLVYDKYYDSGLFIYMFNERNNTEYHTIDDIPKEYNIIEKRYYQKKKLVKKIEAN